MKTMGVDSELCCDFYIIKEGIVLLLRSALLLVFEALFASIPHDWYRKNQVAEYEGYYASIVYCYFVASGLDVIAEDSTSHGRIDLTVRLGDKIFVIEFKVVEGEVKGPPAATNQNQGLCP